MPISTPDLRKAVARIQAGIEPISAELNELDGRIGDGDLGVTLFNGFRNMSAADDDLPNDSGMALFTCAKPMTESSGSSFDKLMATALMAAGKLSKWRSGMEPFDVPPLLEVGSRARRDDRAQGRSPW